MKQKRPMKIYGLQQTDHLVEITLKNKPRVTGVVRQRKIPGGGKNYFAKVPIVSSGLSTVLRP